MSGLIWVQTVCKFISRQKKLPLAGKELNTKHLVDTTSGFIQARLCKIQGLFKDFSDLPTVFKD